MNSKIELTASAGRMPALVMPLWPRPWRKWNGNYQKIQYDIQTTWGKTHIGCWPNAGKMNATDGTGRSWKPHQVAMIRRSIKELPSRHNAEVRHGEKDADLD